MQAITKSDLRKEIHDILKDADLSEITASKVRQQLEKKFKVELITLRSQIDELVMEFVNSQCKSDDSSEESEQEDAKKETKDDDEKSEEDTKKLKRQAPSKKQTAKKSRDSSNDSESDSDDDNVKPAKKTKAESKKKTDSDSDSDDIRDRRVKKRKRAAAAPKKSTGKGKGNGFTRTYTLSPELAKLMGCDSLPRHEVVKKVWQIIKERNLYDPKNKQYAICDSELLTVIGIKRFRSFGMLKYLRNHFID